MVAREVERSAYAHITEKKEHTYTVINPSGWTMNQIVEIPGDVDGRFQDKDGNELISGLKINSPVIAVKKHVLFDTGGWTVRLLRLQIRT